MNNFLKALLIIIVLALLAKKNTKPYHADVYSSWEEEQLDEMRADMNYYDERIQEYEERIEELEDKLGY